MGGTSPRTRGGPRALKYGRHARRDVASSWDVLGGETCAWGASAEGVTGLRHPALFVGREGTSAWTSEIRKARGAARAWATLVATCPAVTAGHAGAPIRKGSRPRSSSSSISATIDTIRPKAAFTFPEGSGRARIIELDGEPRAGRRACCARASLRGAGAETSHRARRRRPRAPLGTRGAVLEGAARGQPSSCPRMSCRPLDRRDVEARRRPRRQGAPHGRPPSAREATEIAR